MNRFLTFLGFLSVGLGILGIFLPVLPTTPFLLLAAWLFLKGNPRWYDWLINHPRLGIYIKNYMQDHNIPLKVKTWSIVTLWVGISISIYFVEMMWVRLLLLAIAVAVSIHILSFKTLK